MRILLFIFNLFIGYGLFSQTQTNQAKAPNDEVYTVVEEMAEFPGGMPALMKFLQENIKYPNRMRDLGVGGKVFLKFIVNEVGNITDVEVIKSTGVSELDEEARRVVLSMPTWKPGRMQGRNVKVYFNLPVSFALSSPYMVFNNGNTNSNYLAAKQAILEKGDYKSAISYYEAIPGDQDSWFNLGVIYWMDNKKREARKFFEDVRDNSKSKNAQLYMLSEKFLNNYF